MRLIAQGPSPEALEKTDFEAWASGLPDRQTPSICRFKRLFFSLLLVDRRTFELLSPGAVR